MISPWQNPLPLEKYTTSRVVVYFYTGRWIPIMFFRYSEAIELHRKAALQGWSIFIFPHDLDPRDFNAFFARLYWQQGVKGYLGRKHKSIY